MVRPNHAYPPDATTGAAARLNSSRAPHGCCSSTVTTSTFPFPDQHGGETEYKFIPVAAGQRVGGWHTHMVYAGQRKRWITIPATGQLGTRGRTHCIQRGATRFSHDGRIAQPTGWQFGDRCHSLLSMR